MNKEFIYYLALIIEKKWGMFMKSIVEEALARAEREKKERIEGRGFEDVEDEILQVLHELKTVIKVIGVGGGGCNTITRMYEEGIEGQSLLPSIQMSSTFTTQRPTGEF